MKPIILYEDKDVLVINKPAGLVVHSDGLPAQVGKTKEKTLVDWILEKYPKLKNVGEPGRSEKGEEIPRPGIVHRLDRETSGAMLVAKNSKSFANLKEQFQKHEIKKNYHAFVYGEMNPIRSQTSRMSAGVLRHQTSNGMKNASGTIDRPIGRSSKDFRLRSAQRGARGEMREAVTDYKVISRTKDYSFVEVSPKTGRTHQIRVHFKAINHSLVADSLYAPNRQNTLGFKRLALHSYSVTFSDLKGKLHTVISTYPQDFNHALKILKKF